MNAPPPPSSEAAESAAAKKGADLSHFKRKNDPAEEVPYKKGANVMGALSSVAENVKAAAAKPKKVKAPAVSAKAKKKVVLSVVGVLVLAAAGGAAVIVPGQIARSKAFAAYEDGQYEDALRGFRGYLRDRPGDGEAALYAARAAIRTGDYEYAASALGRIAGDAAFANNPDFLFTRALALAPAPEAAQILNSLVSIAPDHTGGRLLRGVLQARENEIERAREDFLHADSVIRGDRDHDNTAILSVHRRILGIAAEVLPVFNPPSAADESAAAMRDLSARLGVPALPGLYINRYIPVLPTDEEAAEIGDDNLVGIYYTLLLLADSQFNEALVEFSKLSPAVMHESPAGGLRGIYDALTGEYAAAAKVFGGLSETIPGAELFFNQANAVFGMNPTAEGAREAAELLSRAIELNPQMGAARHNRAVLRLLAGDDAGAAEDLTAAGDAAETTMLRAVAALAADPRGEEIDALLGGLDENTAGLQYARIARLTARREYEDALSLLRGTADATRQWDAANRLYARRLADGGFLMRARNVFLTRAPQDSPEVRYETALLELDTGNAAGGAAILSEMETEHAGNFYTAALRALVLQRNGETEEAKIAIDAALRGAETAAQKRRILLPLADFLLAESPEILREVLRETPVAALEAESAALLARILADEGEAENAAVLAQIAAARHPFFGVQRHAGIALVAAGKSDEAIEMLRAAAEWYPLNVPLWSRLLQLYTDGGRAADAEIIRQTLDNIKRHFAADEAEAKAHSEVLSIDAPKDKKLVQSITRVRAQNAPPDDVEKRFEELIAAVSGDEKKAALTFQRGTFYLAVGEYEKCAEDMRAAINSGMLDAHRARRAGLYLGKALTQVEEFSAAAEVYLRLAAENPHIPLYRRLAGGALSGAGDHLRATDYLTETVALFPADIESYFVLSAAWRNNQNTRNAVAALRKAARIAPLYVPVYVALSRAQQITDIPVAKENSVIARDLSAR